MRPILSLDYQLKSLFFWGWSASYLIILLKIYRDLLCFYLFWTILKQYYYLTIIYLPDLKLCFPKQKVYYHQRKYGLTKNQWRKKVVKQKCTKMLTMRTHKTLRDSVLSFFSLLFCFFFFIYFPSCFSTFWEMDYRFPKSANFKITINELHLYWMLPHHKHLPRISQKLCQTNSFINTFGWLFTTICDFIITSHNHVITV